MSVQVVAPKRAALAEANRKLSEASKKLSTIRARVQELRDRVALLEESLMKVPHAHVCMHAQRPLPDQAVMHLLAACATAQHGRAEQDCIRCH